MNKRDLLNFVDHFSLSRGDLQKLLNTALAHGGNFAEIFLEYRVYSSINMEEDIIKETSENIMLGAGFRVIHGDQTGYGYTNDLSLEKITRAALTASSIAEGSPSQNSPPFQSTPVIPNYYPIHQSAQDESLENKIALVKAAYQSALTCDRKVKKVKVSFIDQTRYITVVNSEGQNLSDVQPLVKLTCLCIAEKANKREAGFSGGGGRVGMEYFSKELTPEKMGEEAAREAISLLEAVQPPAGEMPVVLSPGHSGVLIHEAVGHLLEADFNRKKTSIFWNKMGQRVGSEQIFIYDDPTISFFRGSYNIDDEGTIPKKTPLIERGKLVGLLQDRLSGKFMNKPLTGHGRRQDYTCIPIPRMSNTYIDQGEYDPDEIIISVKKGFYADKFQGGQVEDSGKFTFSVSSGFLIENGKLTAPVKQATLIGTNIDILQKIDKVGSDLTFGLQTGTCGKEGQAVPVTDGCPTLKVAKMTVGGFK
ncbi:MAG: TldD/PmbA family protein [Candidatus Aminicenantes bacterium]|nr:MAG: TldD/PmbA family protein [Candidatus Aminicenantes bacterium]